MKKFLSVFLAALLLFLTCGMIAAAADNDGFTPVYTVRVAPDSVGKIKVIGYNETGANTVVQGHAFYFTIEYQTGYSPDPTVLVKCYPASYPTELVGTPEDVESITLTPDANGIYTIPNVQEDYYVGVYNVARSSQISSIKTMLVRFWEAFLALFRKLFKK